MSIKNYKYWHPVLDLQPFRGFAPDVVETIRDRVISFELKDKKYVLDEIKLILNNNDGRLLDPTFLGLGIVFKVSYGYPGMLASRIMQCRKASGAARVGGVGKDSGPRTAAGGTVTLILKSQIWDMNFERVVSKGEGALVEREGLLINNMTIPEIVTRIANTHGYSGPSLFVEQLDDEPRIEKASIPAKFSAAEWIRDQARRRGWAFAIDDVGFHFHGTDYAPAVDAKETEELTWFAGDPDVIKWNIDGDINIPQGMQLKGSENESVVGYIEGTGLTQFVNSKSKKNRLSPNLLLNTSKPSKRGQARTARFFEKSANKWKLKAQLVGNPKISARKKITLRNFGPLIDGPWYIRECTHSIKTDQVYLTTIDEAVREKKKGGVIKGLLGRTETGGVVQFIIRDDS